MFEISSAHVRVRFPQTLEKNMVACRCLECESRDTESQTLHFRTVADVCEALTVVGQRLDLGFLKSWQGRTRARAPS